MKIDADQFISLKYVNMLFSSRSYNDHFESSERNVMSQKKFFHFQNKLILDK